MTTEEAITNILQALDGTPGNRPQPLLSDYRVELESLLAERERLSDLLREVIESHETPLPPFEAGTDAQKEWGLRRYKAIEAARLAIASPAGEGGGEGK